MGNETNVNSIKAFTVRVFICEISLYRLNSANNKHNTNKLNINKAINKRQERKISIVLLTKVFVAIYIIKPS